METFSLEKENIIQDIKNLFKLKKELNCTAVKDDINFQSSNYIEFESTGERNKTVSVEEYRNDIRKCLKNINNFKKSDTWKIQLKKANGFISSKDNDEEHVVHSKSDNIEVIINDEADEVIK